MKRLIKAVSILLLVTACSSEQAGSKIPPASIPETNRVSYSILKSRAETIGDRKRLFVSIAAAEANTFQNRGRTVVTAARELQRAQAVNVVQVWLEPNENTLGLGFVLAMATYSPDGKGLSGFENNVVWENVNSTGYQLNARAMKMSKDSRLGDIGMEQARIIGSRKPYNP
jgi:hypothetical protein